MTQTTMLPAAPEAPEASNNRRNILLVGGLAAVVLAGGGYFFLAGGSSSDTASDSFVVPHHKAPVTKTVAKKAPAAKAKTVIVPATSTVPIGRNPFKVLYVAPVQTSSTSSSGSTTTSSTTTGTTTGTTSGTTTKTASYSLTLLSITGGTGGYAHQFTFSLGGTKKTVLIGQKFGNYGELQVLTFTRTASGKVTGALVQVGDDDPVPVSIGQKITVQ